MKITKGEILNLDKILRDKKIAQFAATIKKEVNEIIEKHSKK